MTTMIRNGHYHNGVSVFRKPRLPKSPRPLLYTLTDIVRERGSDQMKDNQSKALLFTLLRMSFGGAFLLVPRPETVAKATSALDLLKALVDLVETQGNKQIKSKAAQDMLMILIVLAYGPVSALDSGKEFDRLDRVIPHFQE